MTLGGALFVFNGNKYDYCYRESITNLIDLCDKVVICVIRSDDGTLEEVQKFASDKVKIIILDDTMWFLLSGRDRLSHFSNIAIANLDTDWIYYAQADEITDESSFPYIRQAILSNATGFMVRRINLWNTPYQELIAKNQPCSTQVIRLGRNLPTFRCVDDAESCRVNPVDFSMVNKIIIWHMGFVRDRKVMKNKVINMLTGVFQFSEYDKKLDKADVYMPMDYFSPEDLRPIHKPLSKYIEKWAEKRYLINQTYDRN